MSTTHDAGRYAGLEMKMNCPNCGSGGMIPWKQLAHVLICRGCDKRFRVSRTGLVELPAALEDSIRLQVRTNSSGWQDHRAVLVRAPVWGVRLRDAALALATRGPARWALLVTVLSLAGVSVALAGRKPPPPVPLEIPDSLEGRAAMFTAAVARRDMQVMIRLTDPAQYRALRTWLAHGQGQPAQTPDAVADSDAALSPKALGSAEPGPPAEILATTLTGAAGDAAQLRVRLPASAQNPELVLDEQWVRRGESWYFEPERLRSAAAARSGPVRAYEKPKRHGS